MKAEEKRKYEDFETIWCKHSTLENIWWFRVEGDSCKSWGLRLEVEAAVSWFFLSCNRSFSLSFCQSARWCVTQNAQLACQLLVDCQQNMPRTSLKRSAGIRWILPGCSWRSQAAVCVLKDGWKCRGTNMNLGAVSGAETFGAVPYIILALTMW